MVWLQRSLLRFRPGAKLNIETSCGAIAPWISFYSVLQTMKNQIMRIPEPESRLASSAPYVSCLISQIRIWLNCGLYTIRTKQEVQKEDVPGLNQIYEINHSHGWGN